MAAPDTRARYRAVAHKKISEKFSSPGGTNGVATDQLIALFDQWESHVFGTLSAEKKVGTDDDSRYGRFVAAIVHDLLTNPPTPPFPEIAPALPQDFQLQISSYLIDLALSSAPHGQPPPAGIVSALVMRIQTRVLEIRQHRAGWQAFMDFWCQQQISKNDSRARDAFKMRDFILSYDVGHMLGNIRNSSTAYNTLASLYRQVMSLSESYETWARTAVHVMLDSAAKSLHDSIMSRATGSNAANTSSGSSSAPSTGRSTDPAILEQVNAIKSIPVQFGGKPWVAQQVSIPQRAFFPVDLPSLPPATVPGASQTTPSAHGLHATPNNAAGSGATPSLSASPSPAVVTSTPLSQGGQVHSQQSGSPSTQTASSNGLQSSSASSTEPYVSHRPKMPRRNPSTSLQVLQPAHFSWFDRSPTADLRRCPLSALSQLAEQHTLVFEPRISSLNRPPVPLAPLSSRKAIATVAPTSAAASASASDPGMLPSGNVPHGASTVPSGATSSTTAVASASSSGSQGSSATSMPSTLYDASAKAAIAKAELRFKEALHQRTVKALHAVEGYLVGISPQWKERHLRYTVRLEGTTLHLRVLPNLPTLVLTPLDESDDSTHVKVTFRFLSDAADEENVWFCDARAAYEAHRALWETDRDAYRLAREWLEVCAEIRQRHAFEARLFITPHSVEA